MIVLLLVVLALTVSCFFFFNKKNSSPQIIGGDKDEHGCLIAAGYSWCEAKNKCLRVWEVPCIESASLLEKDEEEVVKKAIEEELLIKYGEESKRLKVTVSKIEGNFAQGGAAEVGVGGGMWFAAKVDNRWLLVWDGNGIILCSDVEHYPDFPNTLIPECFDEKLNKTIRR